MWYKRIGDYKSGFKFYKNNNEITNDKLLLFFKSLKIPPAYNNVSINSNKNSKILAFGFDSKNRKQVIYHPKFIKEQTNKKYERFIRLEKEIPKIKNIIFKDIKSTNIKKKEIAIILFMILNCGFRIGNDKYVKENNSYGLTTLEFRHLIFNKKNIIIEFVGKKGVINKSICNNITIYNYLLNKKTNSKEDSRVFSYHINETIYNINSKDVNIYLKKINNEITSKDLRTWNANHLFIKYINDENILKEKNPIKKAIEMVAFDLHNTPAICRKSYLHPEIIFFIENKIKNDK